MFKKIFVLFVLIFMFSNVLAVTYDDFEDGDWTDDTYYDWVYSNDDGDGVIEVSTDVAFEGSYSLKSEQGATNSDKAEFNETPPTDFSFWVYLATSGGKHNGRWYDGGTNKASVLLTQGTGFGHSFDGGMDTVYSGTIAEDTWYRIRIVRTNGTRYTDIYLYDSDGVELYSELNIDYGSTFNTTKVWFYANGANQTIYYDDVGEFYELTLATPTIIDPNGGENYFVNATTKEIEIDFNMNTNLDINSVQIDLNYGTSGTQGTGTTILTDNNIGTNGVVCDSNIGNDYSCSYTWDYTGVGTGDYYIQMETSSSGSSQYDASDATFGIINPNITFNIYDEETNLLTNGATISVSPSIDGNSSWILTDTNTQTINLNTIGITDSTFTFTISKANNQTRYYIIDLNNQMKMDVNFALLNDTNGTNVEFKLYEPDQSTLLSNAYISVTNYNRTGLQMDRLKTNASGEVTLNLNMTDGNYLFSIIASDGDTFDYNTVALTVYRPKDETTGADINANWDITLSGLTSGSYENIEDTRQIIAVYSNTVQYYILNIGSDSNDPVYNDRKYEFNTTGNPSTETIQPFLTSSEDATAIKLVTLADNGYTVESYPYVEIQIYKNITGEGRSLIEQTLTDAKGEAFVTLVAGDTYEFEIYVDEVLQTFNGSSVQYLKITGSEIYFTIVTATSSVSQTTQYGFNVSWTPSYQYLDQNSGATADFSQTITNGSGENIVVVSTISQNGIVLSTDSYTGSASTTTLNHSVGWASITGGSLEAKIVITYDGTDYNYTYIYHVGNNFGGYYDPIYGLRYGLRSDFGCGTGICIWLIAIALIISIGAVLYASIVMGALGSQSGSIAFGIMLSFFTYLYWIPLELCIAVWIAILAFVISDRRGS